MSNTIQANYGAKGIALSAERHKTKGLRASSFLDAAGQTEKKAAEMPSASRNSGAGEEFLPAKLMMEQEICLEEFLGVAYDDQRNGISYGAGWVNTGR